MCKTYTYNLFGIAAIHSRHTAGEGVAAIENDVC